MDPMNRDRLRALAVVALLLVLAAAVALLMTGRGGTEQAEAGSVVAELSALRSAPGADEKLPVQVANGFVRDAGGQIRAARAVGEFENSDYYLVPTDDDQVCLVSQDPGGVSGGACVNRVQLLEGVSVISHSPDGHRVVATIVPDGYGPPEFEGAQVMKRSPVQRNVAFAKLEKGEAELHLQGVAGRPDITHTVH